MNLKSASVITLPAASIADHIITLLHTHQNYQLTAAPKSGQVIQDHSIEGENNLRYTLVGDIVVIGRKISKCQLAQKVWMRVGIGDPRSLISVHARDVYIQHQLQTSSGRQGGSGDIS